MTTTEDRPRFVRSSRISERARLGGIGALITTAVMGVTAGPSGILAGGLLVVLWYVRLPVYGFALGHVVLVVLFPDPLPPVRLGIIEAGLIGLLVSAGYRPDRTRGWIREFVPLGAGVVCLLAVGALVRRWTDALWIIAAAIIAAAMVAAYGLHRYELVRLGLVEEDDVA